MNLYLISQDDEKGYETYDSAVVCAESAEDAASIYPAENDGYYPRSWDDTYSGEWCSTPEKVSTKLIGVAASGVNRGVILASFNAG